MRRLIFDHPNHTTSQQADGHLALDRVRTVAGWVRPKPGFRIAALGMRGNSVVSLAIEAAEPAREAM